MRRNTALAHFLGGQGDLQLDSERASLPVGGIIEMGERLGVAAGPLRHGVAKRRERLLADDPRAYAGQEILGEERSEGLIFPRMDIARRPVVEEAIAGDMLGGLADRDR